MIDPDGAPLNVLQQREAERMKMWSDKALKTVGVLAVLGAMTIVDVAFVGIFMDHNDVGTSWVAGILGVVFGIGVIATGVILIGELWGFE